MLGVVGEDRDEAVDVISAGLWLDYTLTRGLSRRFLPSPRRKHPGTSAPWPGPCVPGLVRVHTFNPPFQQAGVALAVHAVPVLGSLRTLLQLPACSPRYEPGASPGGAFWNGDRVVQVDARQGGPPADHREVGPARQVPGAACPAVPDRQALQVLYPLDPPLPQLSSLPGCAGSPALPPGCPEECSTVRGLG